MTPAEALTATPEPEAQEYREAWRYFVRWYSEMSAMIVVGTTRETWLAFLAGWRERQVRP